MGVLIVRQAGHHHHVSNDQVALAWYGEALGPLLFVDLPHGGAQALYNAVSRAITRGFIDEIHFFQVNLTGLVPFHDTRQTHRAIEAVGDYFRHDSVNDRNFPVTIRFTDCTPSNPNDSQIRLLARFWRLAWVVARIDAGRQYLLQIQGSHSRSGHTIP